MGRLYVHLALSLQALIMLTGLFFYITLHPETTELIAQKALKDNGIGYSRIEGCLFCGFTLYDVTYQKAFRAKRLAIRYSIFSLISQKPTLTSIALADVKVYPLLFKTEEPDTTQRKNEIVLPPVLFQMIDIKRCTVILPKDEKIAFDLHIDNLLFQNSNVEIEKFMTDIRTPYGSGRFRGKLQNRTVTARGYAKPGKAYKETARKYLANLPERLPLQLKVDMHHLEASTEIANSVSVKDANLSIQHFNLRFDYLFGGNYFTAKAAYRLEHPSLSADINQSILFTPSLAYAAKTIGEINSSTFPLPSNRFELDAAGDTGVFTSDLYMGPFTLSAYSTDYKKFALHAAAKPHRPTYIEHLPPILLHQTIGMEANATAMILPDPTVNGIMVLDGNYSRTKSFFEIKPDMLLVRSSVTPKESGGGIWEYLPRPMVGKIESFLYLSKKEKMFNLSTPKSYLTLFEKDKKIEGWANIGSLTLDVKGQIEPDGTTNLDFVTHVESLHTLMEEFDLASDIMIDAEIKSRFSVTLADRLLLTYRIEIPWYLIEPDSQTVIYGIDSNLEGNIKGEEIRIDRYSVAIKEHRFEEERDSIFHFDDNQTVVIDKIVFLDSGMIKGYFSLQTSEGVFSMTGKELHYSGPEGNVTTDINMTAAVSPSAIDVEGEVQIVDATIVYKPPREYTVNDEDIVIIQDIKKPSHTRKRLNIRIFSKKPLLYKIPMVESRFIPDITIWKEPEKPAVLLGIVKVVDGSVEIMEKHFKIEPSEIYFSGAHPINPWLNIHVLYEVDFNKFHIYVSHTLANPVFLFSSEPPMSQNDIMSYILFGEPADEAFKQSTTSESTIGTMLLGAGLKTAIGSATGIRFDTLNILNIPEGGFGIEVGKRLSRRIRIIYRNDTVSSFIIQYKVSRSIRIDVDVRDTGQGISILYVKDIREPGK